MIPLLFLLAFASTMPSTNLNATCQSAKAAALPGQDEQGAFESCLHDESAARDELKQKWGSFSADSKSVCAEPKGVTFSYVELLTCLEMQSGNQFDSPHASPAAPPQ
jgi:hypothetical protein